MLSKKRVKRLLIFSLVLVVLFLAFLIFRSVRKVRFQYARHPEKFQVVAEYFCAQKAEQRFTFSVYRVDIDYHTLPDEDWPAEVSDAVRYIFRHSDCNSIYASETWSGVSYCIFEDPIHSDAQEQTGVVYTPRESGHEILDDFFSLPVSHGSALADHWFAFTLVSNEMYNSYG